MNPNDVFADMLVGDETIVAGMGAPGVRRDHRQVWWQVALTSYRMLVVRMVQNPAGWVIEDRQAARREALELHQYPATPSSQARLELRGFREPIALLEIDREDLNPQLDSFLSAWGRPVTGVQRVPVRSATAATPKVLGSDPETLKMIAVLAAGMGLVGLCCGCGGMVVVLRDLFTRYGGS